MPAPRPCLNLEAVERFVREECFAPSNRGLVGIELEYLTFPTAQPSQRWSAVELHQALAGAKPPAGSKVTFEPGGQLELSSPPRAGLAAALAVLAVDSGAVGGALRRAGIEPVARGLDPLRRPVRVLDESRYAAMEAFFDVGWPAGRTMMCSTAALQVNLDLGAAADIARRWRLAHAAGPVLAAVFAHSPGVRGVPGDDRVRGGNGGSEPRSARLGVWAALDPSRTASVHHVDHSRADRSVDPAQEWLGYALAARVMLVRVEPDRFVPLSGETLPFGVWLRRGHELGYPTLDDFAYHLTTLFPPVRPKGWLELRMLDSLPDPWWRVAVAVTVAVFDDPEAAAVAETAAATLSSTATGSADGSGWWEAARYGLAHPGLRTAAESLYQAALGALPRLGAAAATRAAAENFFERFVARGRCPADEPAALPEDGVAVAAGPRPTWEEVASAVAG